MDQHTGVILKDQQVHPISSLIVAKKTMCQKTMDQNLMVTPVDIVFFSVAKTDSYSKDSSHQNFNHPNLLFSHVGNVEQTPSMEYHIVSFGRVSKDPRPILP